MANTTIVLGSEEFTLSLNFNTTIALLAYQEALVAKGAQAGLEETDIRGLLARIARPETPMSVKVTLVRTMLWALIASEQHPEWIDDPIGTAFRLGSKISPFEIDRISTAVAGIAGAIAEHMAAETAVDSAGDAVAKE